MNDTLDLGFSTPQSIENSIKDSMPIIKQSPDPVLEVKEPVKNVKEPKSLGDDIPIEFRTDDEIDEDGNLKKDKKTKVEPVLEAPEEIKDSPYRILLEDWRDKGWVTEVPEGDIDDDTFTNTLFNAERNRILNSAPKQNQEVIQYLLNGGSIDDYNQAVLPESGVFDIDNNPSDAKAFLGMYLQNTTSFSQEKINDQLERLEKYGTLTEEAKIAAGDWDEIRETRKQQTLQAQEKELQDRQLAEQNSINNLKKLITESQELKGIPFTYNKQRKDAFTEYLFKPSVKLGNENVPQHYIDMQKEQQDPETWAMLAWMRFNKYNFKDIIAKQIEKDTKRSTIDRLKAVTRTEKKFAGQSYEYDSNEDPIGKLLK